MKVLIILRCEGRQNKNFKFCSGVENIILDLEKISSTKDYINLVKYIDSVSHLFDGPCFKNNIITNTIYKIYEMGYLTQEQYENIYVFYNMHYKCGGMVLECIPKNIQKDKT
jgi:hypothetical protein